MKTRRQVLHFKIILGFPIASKVFKKFGAVCNCDLFVKPNEVSNNFKDLWLWKMHTKYVYII